MKTWVKLYTEINRDPKMLRLTWAQRGIWSALLALAGEIDDQDEDGITGYVGSLDDVALLIRCDEDEFSEAISAFAERGMVENREGILYLSRYAERQQRAPSNAREAVTERVQRHRRRQANECNEGVTSLHAQRNEDVTRLQRGVTPSDSDSDSDSEADADAEFARAPARGSSSNRVKHLFALLDRAGVTPSPFQSEQWCALLDLTPDETLLDDAFTESATKNNRQPTVAYIRSILTRCLAEGKRPGEFGGNGHDPGPRSPPVRLVKRTIVHPLTGERFEAEVEVSDGQNRG